MSTFSLTDLAEYELSDDVSKTTGKREGAFLLAAQLGKSSACRGTAPARRPRSADQGRRAGFRGWAARQPRFDTPVSAGRCLTAR
jgi:hypothetical protein